jgi:hypothetical protein
VTTAFLLPVGPDTIFPPGKPGVGFEEITDGAANTILVVEAKRNVPWTKPEDLSVTPDREPGRLGWFNPDGFHAAYADGSVRFIEAGTNAKALYNAFTRAGGETVLPEKNPVELVPQTPPREDNPQTPPGGIRR